LSVTSRDIDHDAAPRTQAERSAQSDAAMIEAAKALILERGTEKTTLQLIGERAGYSRGLASYRFGTKAGLFQAVGRSILRHWMSHLDKAVDGQVGVDAMCAAAEAYRRFIQKWPDEIRVLHILLCEAASPRSEFRQIADESYERQREDVADWVRRGMEQGTVRSDVDPDSEGARYVAYISGMTYLWLISPDAIDWQRVNDDFKIQIRRTLTP
jgi:AcrR family transcriptional regulator